MSILWGWILLSIILNYVFYSCWKWWDNRPRKPQTQAEKENAIRDFYLESITAQEERVPGTGGMTLKEYYLHNQKSLSTVCANCNDPHSLRMTSADTLTCNICNSQQSF